MHDENVALVALLRTRPQKLTWRKLTREVRSAGSALEVWQSYHPDGLITSSCDTVALDQAAADLLEWERDGLTFLSLLDHRFPRRLRDLEDPPPFLFARGHLVADDPAVAVVGSRNASPHGIKLTTAITNALLTQNLTVVSGLAAGVDAAAHSATLDNGGRTVAFIATGLNNSYPAANRALQHSVAERGLVFSQFWPDAAPQKQNFLKRNALIASYSHAAVVVEAGEHSGARNLARHAIEQGRPLILTDLVINANQWAQQILSTPGVHQISGLKDLADVIARIPPHQAHEQETGEGGRR